MLVCSQFCCLFLCCKGKKKKVTFTINRSVSTEPCSRRRYYTNKSCNKFFPFTRTAVQPEGLAQGCETLLNNCNGLQCTRTPMGNQSRDQPQAFPQHGAAGGSSTDGALVIGMAMNIVRNILLLLKFQRFVKP